MGISLSMDHREKLEILNIKRLELKICHFIDNVIEIKNECKNKNGCQTITKIF